MYLCRKRGPVWVVLVYLFTCVLVPSLRCTCVGGGPSLSWWAKEVVGCLLLLGPRTHVEPSSTSPFKDFPFILSSHKLKFIETFTKDFRPFWIPLEYLEILLLPTPALTSQRNNPLTKKHWKASMNLPLVNNYELQPKKQKSFRIVHHYQLSQCHKPQTQPLTKVYHLSSSVHQSSWLINLRTPIIQSGHQA